MQVVNHEGMVVVRTMFSQTRMVGGQVGVIMRQVAKVRFWPDAQHCNQPNGPDPGEKKGGNRMPTKAQLFRSTVMAGIGAAVIMVTVYLPAEYAIDPTGIGRVIGLTEMGEIKVQLAAEAEADRLLDEQRARDQSSSVLDAVFGLFVVTAHAQEAQGVWRDEVTFTLEPGATAEIKMTIKAGGVAEYAWTATGGWVNFDLHAHSGGEPVDYERGAGQTEGAGSIEAPFAGDHGWFWRNCDSTAITMTIQLRGEYTGVVETY